MQIRGATQAKPAYPEGDSGFARPAPCTHHSELGLALLKIQLEQLREAAQKHQVPRDSNT